MVMQLCKGGGGMGEMAIATEQYAEVGGLRLRQVYEIGRRMAIGFPTLGRVASKFRL
jgi:hypothetical protein